jgi:hypothetical protein
MKFGFQGELLLSPPFATTGGARPRAVENAVRNALRARRSGFEIREIVLIST